MQSRQEKTGIGLGLGVMFSLIFLKFSFSLINIWLILINKNAFIFNHC